MHLVYRVIGFGSFGVARAPEQTSILTLQAFCITLCLSEWLLHGAEIICCSQAPLDPHHFGSLKEHVGVDVLGLGQTLLATLTTKEGLMRLAQVQHHVPWHLRDFVADSDVVRDIYPPSG